MAKKQAAPAAREWWRGAVIYQIYPRSYQDTTGDGSGDLRGITRRLPHIASIGADAIWISPFFKSPMADMGYDVSDYCDVDPMFGTLEDFDALIAEAHRLGLKVIIDQVLSHSSDQHPWFAESRKSRKNPKADWYVWADPKPDGSPPNNWLSIFGGPAWEWDSVRRQYYLHNFLASQPDLNFHNPKVQKALLDTVEFWLKRGVDGFRLDTVNFYFHNASLKDNPPFQEDMSAFTHANPYEYQYHLYDKTQPDNLAFLKKLRALLDRYGDRCTVGEVGDIGERSLKIVADYTSGGDKLNMCYTFDLLGPQFSPKHFADCITHFETAVSDGWVCWAFSNHDVTRHVSRWTSPQGSTDRVAKLSAALLVSLRGSICMYQGDELGLEEADIAFEDLRDPYGIRFWPGFKGRDGCRTPMPWEADKKNAGFTKGTPWLPVPPAHAEMAVSAQQRDKDSVLAAYRQMVAFRKAHPALVEGDIEVLEAARDVLALLRTSGSERILCLFNLSEKNAKWKLPTQLGKAEVLPALDLGATVDGRNASLPALSSLFLKVS